MSEGNWVIPLKKHLGTWQDLAVVKAAELLVIPKDCMAPEYAALSQQLCLAYCLLEQFGKLKVLAGSDASSSPEPMFCNRLAQPLRCGHAVNQRSTCIYAVLHVLTRLLMETMVQLV